MGDDGLVRVGGRLRHAVGHGVCSQPVIIPHCHPVARCIVNDYHYGAHLGAEWTVSLIRKTILDHKG